MAFMFPCFREAKIELGEAVAARLKLTEDGSIVLWPQPTDSPDDPQNWSNGRKSLMLLIVTLAAIVPDFDSGIGAQTLFCVSRNLNFEQVLPQSLLWPGSTILRLTL